jgi:hypothetical protein
LVVLGLKEADSGASPLMLVSCQEAAPSATERDLIDDCASQILRRTNGLHIGAARKVQGRQILMLEGPQAAVEILSGPLSGVLAETAKADPGDKKAEGPGLEQALLTVPQDWECQFDQGSGVVLAWPKAMPASKIRIEAASVSGIRDEQVSASEGSTTQADDSSEGSRVRSTLAFARAVLLGSGRNGLQPLRLRFFPPAVPENCAVACDTGAVSLPVPDGWELLYFEERLWVADTPEPSVKPAPWPWLPKASEAQAADPGAQERGGLLLGARTRGGTTAVVACLSPSRPPEDFMPAFRALLEGLQLRPQPGAAQTAESRSTAFGAASSVDFVLPDHTTLVDTPQWLWLMEMQQQEIEARNEAILAGADVTDPQLEAAMDALEDAVERLNDEIPFFSPAGEPDGWRESRLDELLQQIYRERW